MSDLTDKLSKEIHQAAVEFCAKQKFAPVFLIEEAMTIAAALAVKEVGGIIHSVTEDLRRGH